MSATARVAGLELAYREQGSGSPLLLIHGMAADAAVWDPVLAGLGDGIRVIAYDRRGYGASEAPEPYERTTVEEQASDALALLEQLEALPATVCGVDLGALACLDLLKRHREAVRAAVVVDVPLFAFVPEATEALSAERAMLEGALREGGPANAVAAWLGPEADASRVQRAARAHGAFFADYAGLASWPVTRRELRGIDRPIAIVDGPTTAPHVRAAGDALAALLPDVTRRSDGDVTAALRELPQA
jgi:pimeloyl-ACP methyl ester carboxylesterase